MLLGPISFHLAFAHWLLAPLILVYLGALVELSRQGTPRAAFYFGLVFGLLVFVPKLGFFYTIFNFAAVPLWTILALWHGLFVFASHWTRSRFKPTLALFLIPIVWTGFEYFRSELYFLKFSWLAAGYAFAQKPNVLLSIFGVYGAGFILMLAASMIAQFKATRRIAFSIAAIALLFGVAQIAPLSNAQSKNSVHIAGIQMEFPVELEVPGKLDLLLQKYPEAELLVLSEYTFDGPIPPRVRKWCKQNKKYLIAGGKDPAGTNFYNTAFVIDPNGEIIFKQVKAVPIQFFKDGLPAPEQHVWDSPWGKIGLGVCYDLSYTRVVDNLITQGAQLLIFPTMDVVEWGQTQHKVHALIAPTRAAEYGIPIFRLASSGISQAVTSKGETIASATFPGESESISEKMNLATVPTRPLDRFIAPLCSGVAFAFLLMALLKRNRRRLVDYTQPRSAGFQPAVSPTSSRQPLERENHTSF
jgi:apolipoprotein N-acyltransferase